MYQWDFSYPTQCPTVTNRIQLFNTFFFSQIKYLTLKLCCYRTYESEGGNCVAQKITPKPTIQPKKTTITVTSRRTKTTLPITSTIQPKKTTITVTSRRTKTTLPITSKVSTTKPSSPLNNTKKNESHLTTPWRSSRNPLKATGELHVVSGLRNIMFKFATNQKSTSLLRFLLHVAREWHANSLIAWEVSNFYLKTKKFHVWSRLLAS